MRHDSLAMESTIGLDTASTSGQTGEFRCRGVRLGREAKRIRGRNVVVWEAHGRRQKRLESISVASGPVNFPGTVVWLRL